MQDLLLSLSSTQGLALLALVAFSDTLIGVGFFVFSEIAFLAAGASLAANGAVAPVLLVLLAAWLGDLVSYWIGRRYGARLSLRYLNRQKRRRAWRRAKRALGSNGGWFVVLSRLLGPTAWVTPFLAGTLQMPLRIFAPASALGVALGVGQVLIYGAVGQQGLSWLLPLLSDHLWSLLLLLLLAVSALYVWRRSERPLLQRLTKVLLVTATLFAGSNLTYFFLLNSHPTPAQAAVPLANVCAAREGPFLAYPGTTALHLPQPVNVILLSPGGPAPLMAALGWQRNLTFSRDQIGLSRYLQQLWQNRPPVSELLLAGHPADSAFQLPGSLRTREHIRWWDRGAGVSFGAISRDEELAVKYYRHLPVLLHDIAPEVDQSRELLARQLQGNSGYRLLGHAALQAPVSEGARSDFQTDGQLLVIAAAGVELPAELQRCLSIRPLPGEAADRLPGEAADTPPDETPDKMTKL